MLYRRFVAKIEQEGPLFRQLESYCGSGQIECSRPIEHIVFTGRLSNPAAQPGLRGCVLFS